MFDIKTNLKNGYRKKGADLFDAPVIALRMSAIIPLLIISARCFCLYNANIYRYFSGLSASPPDMLLKEPAGVRKERQRRARG